MAVEITDEVRRAVYAADCEELGHRIALRQAINPVGADEAGTVVQSSDPPRLPYLTCDRCRRVWIVLPFAGWTYDDAERVLYGMLRPETELARQIVRNRGAAGAS